MGKLKEGAKLPDGLEIRVIEQPTNTIYFVLPTSCDGGKFLFDEELEHVAGGGVENGISVTIYRDARIMG